MSDIPDPIFSNDYTVLKECRHGFFLYNRNDTFIGRSLDIYGEWCEGELVALFQVVQPGHVVIDVGANIGTHTVPLAKKVTETGMTLAFEPQRQAFNYLTANLVVNNLLNVATFQNAVSDTAGVLHLPWRDPRLAFNFGGVKLEESSEGEPVDVLTLDHFGLERVNLIKVDVEGMERKVLEGAAATIKRARPVLFVETTTVNHREVIEILRDYRYDCWWHIATYYNGDNFFHNPEDVFSDIHPESNLLCFPREESARIDGMEKVAGGDDTWQKAIERIRERRSDIGRIDT